MTKEDRRAYMARYMKERRAEEKRQRELHNARVKRYRDAHPEETKEYYRLQKAVVRQYKKLQQAEWDEKLKEFIALKTAAEYVKNSDKSLQEKFEELRRLNQRADQLLKEVQK